MVLSFFGTVYAVPQLDPTHAFDYSEIVIIGKILSVEILFEPQITKTEKSSTEISGIALYNIQVEKSLKNPNNVDDITVPGLFLREPHGMSYSTYPYEVDQRVLLYLQKNDHGYADTELIIRQGDSGVITEQLCPENTSYHTGLCHLTNNENKAHPPCINRTVLDCMEHIVTFENEFDNSICGPGTELIDGICNVIDMGCEPDMYGNIYCVAEEEGQKINLQNAIKYFFTSDNYEGVIHYENYLVFLLIPFTIILVLIWKKRK